MIDPSHKTHADLDADMVACVGEHGGLCDCLAYHSSPNVAWVRALKEMRCPEAYHVRARADRLAVFPGINSCFDNEPKTHGGKSPHHNWAFEVLPLANHLHNLWTRLDCLYAYRDPEYPLATGGTRTLECGFWVSDLPPLARILIPAVWSEPRNRHMLDFFRETFERFFPDVPRREGVRVAPGWSKDPFVIVEREHLERLPHWADLIRQFCRRAQSPAPPCGQVRRFRQMTF